MYPEMLEYDGRKRHLLLRDEILDKAAENKSEDKNYVNKEEHHDILDAEVLSDKFEEIAIPDHIIVDEAELIKKISKLNDDQMKVYNMVVYHIKQQDIFINGQCDNV
uniref:Uncharacterized protein n=1 Tax=Romanomermis culicivorax TaxID=13658 RepID=A0A915I1U8_ROMCU